MKKTKIIIPALGMLLLSTAASITGTVAWFAMNTTVTATGMKIEAKIDNAFLVISAGDTLSGNATTATGTMDSELYPTKPVVALTSTNISQITTWGSATSTDPTDANTSASVIPFTSGTLSNYVAVQSYMVGILANSGEVANNLKLDSLTISDVTDGITVVVVCGTNLYSHAVNVTGGTEVLAEPSLVTTDGVRIDVYVYIDGSHPNVKTANAVNLGGNVSMTFSIA